MRTWTATRRVTRSGAERSPSARSRPSLARALPRDRPFSSPPCVPPLVHRPVHETWGIGSVSEPRWSVRRSPWSVAFPPVPPPGAQPIGANLTRPLMWPVPGAKMRVARVRTGTPFSLASSLRLASSAKSVSNGSGRGMIRAELRERRSVGLR